MTLCETESSPYGASWGADGNILIGQGAGGIFRVPASGGEPEVLIEVSATERELAQSPVLLPGGDSVLFTLLRGGRNWDEAQIVAQSLETGERDVLVEGGADARYVTTGHLVYALGESLFAVPFHLSQLAVTGGAVPVLEGVRRAASGAAHFALSRSGSLAYISPDVAQEDLRTLVWVDRQGVVEPVTTARRDYRMPRLSHGGDRLAVAIGPFREADVWVLDLTRDTLTRLTFNGGGAPIWTPDDQRVTYAFPAFAPARFNIFWKSADGTGPDEPLVEEDVPLLETGGLFPSSWSPDARTLIFRQRRGSGMEDDIGVLSMQGDPKLEFLTETAFVEGHPILSADGRWLAYTSDESGRREVYVRSFLEPGGRWQISTEGGTEPRWNPDGNELFYRRGDEMWAVAVTPDPAFQPGRPTLLFEGSFEPGGTFHNYDVAPDGKRFVMVQSEETSASAPERLHVVLHWLDELERRVPVN